ncbi:MAG: hypothetical protein AB1724_12530 [Thermodesulfobacteriota bacterium]
MTTIIALGALIAVPAASAGSATVSPGVTAPAGPAAAQVPLRPGAPANPGQSGQPQAAGPTDIHDIRQPVQVGVNPMIYYGIFAGVAALAAGVLIWILVRRRMKKKSGGVTEVTAAVYRTPEEEALENLTALENGMSGEPALFYFGLSAAFRRYLQRRFNIDAPEMTTEELLPRLSALDVEKEIQAGLKSFIKFGDQVKFARALPDRSDMTAHLVLVRDLVNRFVPSEPPAAGQAEVK